MLERARGFCDLNIPAETADLKETVLHALSLGYQTIAINQHVNDTSGNASKKEDGTSKKRKKDAKAACVPPPVTLKLSESDLKQRKITRQPVILTRLTIRHSDPSSPFMSKFANEIRQYDLVAIMPENDLTLKQITVSKVDVDIISFPLELNTMRLSRSLIKAATDKDICYEICYSPCLLNASLRKQTIELSHFLHRSVRSANVILTSKAKHASQLRYPYDVVNLGKFLGLTEQAAKWSIGITAQNAIYCATARKEGVSKCAAQIVALDEAVETPIYDGLGDASSFLKITNGIDDRPKKKRKLDTVFLVNKKKGVKVKKNKEKKLKVNKKKVKKNGTIKKVKT